ncbi:MAG: hypothetical protein ACPGVT_11755 [Maricaulaceae bacterium]
MRFIAIILSARFWLTLMVSITMGLSTAVADIHPPDPDEIDCQEIQLADSHGDASALAFDIADGDENGEHERKHDHHAHHCGTCHVHAVDMRLSSMSLMISGEQALSIGADQAVARAGPFGLYRPPRA